jgi:hypothetical protein
VLAANEKATSNGAMPKSLATGEKLHKYNLTELVRALRNRCQNKSRLKNLSRKPFLPKSRRHGWQTRDESASEKDENHEHS